MKFDYFLKLHNFDKSAVEAFVDAAYVLSDHDGYFDPQDVMEMLQSQDVDTEDICPHGYIDCDCMWVI